MENKVALVTGAGRGIGRAIAHGLAGCGHRVAVTARSRQELDSLVRQITQAGGYAWAIADDLSDREALARIVSQVGDHWGPIAILVNNAGVGSSADPRPLVEFNDDFWDLTMEVNVTAPYRLIKLVGPSMIEQGWGRIINVASIAGKVAGMHNSAYCVSKHAMLGLTKSAAMELIGHGITVNAVCPGVTRSSMNDKRLEYDSQRLGLSLEELEIQSTPLGRRLVPEEIAALAVHLASDEARAINGQCINVCGGSVMV